jgi:hypothetical protein
VGGGRNNTADGTDACVVGGDRNRATNDYAAIGGGLENTAGEMGTVGGGWLNVAEFGATVAGGSSNAAAGTVAAIGGGWKNLASGYAATIGGGQNNSATSSFATVGGGWLNVAESTNATVSGGLDNNAGGRFSTVGGGRYNTARGYCATIPGGSVNYAADRAFAAGTMAKANHAGSFVWGDDTDFPVESTASNQVLFRCNGGVRFQDTMGFQYAQWTPGAASWSIGSYRDVKQDLTAVDSRAVLAKVAALPVTEWNYVGYPQRHIGVMAQDFHAAFPLAGSSDKATDGGDLHGVAIAAIQGLVQELEAQRREIQDLKARINQLESRPGL